MLGHTADVVKAVTALVDALGDRLIDQFGLSCNLPELRATARKSAYIHDWGKANHHFQMVVRHQRDPIVELQMIRHEIVSLLLAWDFREWLSHGEGDFLTAIVAAAGHHLKIGVKAGKRTDNIAEIRQSGDDKLLLYVINKVNGRIEFNKNFHGLLKYGVKSINLPEKIKLSNKIKENLNHGSCLSWSITNIKEKQLEIEEFLLKDSDKLSSNSVFIAVIKSLLIAGDAIGSALGTMKNFSLQHWISQQIQSTLDEIKLQKVINERLGGKQLRPFQIQLSQSSARVTLARAGCGTGKTLGAYNWAKSKAIGRKLIFCYPTTGTSTEGFLDYVHNQVDSVLLHSRSDVDLEMAATGEEIEVGEEMNNEAAIKLESFKAWGKEAIICTVDTVLGLLQCNRRPIYCFPAIAQAAFVFDEVHCYDNRLFGALLRFLEVVKAPILLMSASFLPWQKEAIEKAVGERVEIISGPQDLEELRRYRFYYAENPEWQRVEEELNGGGKVLWVCNQVNTAISVYQKAKDRGISPLLYHSRYRYQDRVQHHRSVIEAFKQDNQEPVLAIATQVAEMSLDLSATLLVSQIADPSGLIQRLGRLNRRYCGRALDAIFYPDAKEGYPYSPEELEEGLRLIRSFSGDVCQKELARWLESSAARAKPDTESILLDGEWRTYSSSLREGSFNVTVVLEQDIEIIKSLPTKKIASYTIPILVKREDDIKRWQRYKYYPIAPISKWKYSPEIGAYEI